jgi:hypothetical protein
MPQLLIQEGTYYAQSDEASFFGCLQSIPGVVSLVGTPKGLIVNLRTRRLSKAALWSLVALHFRYGLPMHELAQFETAENVLTTGTRQGKLHAPQLRRGHLVGVSRHD